MANTYTQIYMHVVFAVKGRQNVISKKWKEELYKYITGIVTKENQKLMIVNGMPDHIHLLLGLKPNCNLSNLIKLIKANSSKWINDKRYVMGKFEWQAGFGAFTLGQVQLPKIINYIKEQESHHKKTTFSEEYINFLKANEIDYNSAYLFKAIF